MPGSFARTIKQLDLFVRQSVKLNTPSANGPSLRKTLEDGRKFQKAKGKSDEELALLFAELVPVALEPGTDYLVGVFEELSDTRNRTESGPLAITHVEMKAYSELTGTELDPWEVDALRIMDAAFLHEAYEIHAKRNKNPTT